MTVPVGTPVAIPPELEVVRAAARRAISPIKPADSKTKADQQFLFTPTRTNAGKQLPPYYLVYFLLVDLLGFRDLGRFEKLAWSVPIDFEGVAYLIDHRKFGVGVFARKGEEWERQAARIVKLINKGVAAAKSHASGSTDACKSRNPRHDRRGRSSCRALAGDRNRPQQQPL